VNSKKKNEGIAKQQVEAMGRRNNNKGGGGGAAPAGVGASFPPSGAEDVASSSASATTTTTSTSPQERQRLLLLRQERERDELHNSDHPSCLLLREIALDALSLSSFAEDVDGSSGSSREGQKGQKGQRQQQAPPPKSPPPSFRPPPALSDLIRRQILVQSGVPLETTAAKAKAAGGGGGGDASAAGNNNKKKKKKKKKGGNNSNNKAQHQDSACSSSSTATTTTAAGCASDCDDERGCGEGRTGIDGSGCGGVGRGGAAASAACRATADDDKSGTAAGVETSAAAGAAAAACDDGGGVARAAGESGTATAPELTDTAISTTTSSSSSSGSPKKNRYNPHWALLLDFAERVGRRSGTRNTTAISSATTTTSSPSDDDCDAGISELWERMLRYREAECGPTSGGGGKKKNSNVGSNNGKKQQQEQQQQQRPPAAAAVASDAADDDDGTKAAPAVFAISPADVDEWTKRIACPSCRRQVESIFHEGKRQLPLKPVPSRTRLGVGGGGGGGPYGAVRNPFDYVAMEEGTLPGDLFGTSNNLDDEDENAAGELVFELVPGPGGKSGGRGQGKNHGRGGDGSSMEGYVWELQCYERSSNDYGSGVGLTRPMTLEDWNRILLHYVLGRGMPRDGIVERMSSLSTSERNTAYKTVNLSDNLVSSVLTSADERCNKHKQLLTGVAHALERMYREQITEADEENSSSINIAAFPTLKGIDEEAISSLIQLWGLLLDVTKELFQGLPCADDGRFSRFYEADQLPLKQIALKAWSLFAEVVRVMGKAMRMYEDERPEHASCRGALDSILLSKPLRDLYRHVVKQKLESLAKLLAPLGECFDSEVEIGLPASLDAASTTTTFRRKIATQYTYAVGVSGNCSHRQRSGVVATADQAVENFGVAVLECLGTPCKASMRQVSEEHQLRRRKLHRRANASIDGLEDLVKMSSDNYASIRTEKVASLSHLRRLFDDDESGCSKPTDDATNGLREWAYLDEIGGALFEVVSAWIEVHCRIAPSSMPAVASSSSRTADEGVTADNDDAQVLPPPFLPDKILKTMVSPQRHFQLVDDDNFGGHVTNLMCSGSAADAEQRAVCILIGIAYRWTAKVWEEWRAELAEQELLSSMEAELSVLETGSESSTPKGGAKQGKKNRKKKRGDGISPKNGPNTNQVQESENCKNKDGASAPGGATRKSDSVDTTDIVADEKKENSSSTNETDSLSAHPSAESAAALGKNGEIALEEEKSFAETDAVKKSDNGSKSMTENVGEKKPEATVPGATSVPVEDGSAKLYEDIDSFLAIGVYDNRSSSRNATDDFVSAEEFLVGRLAAVLAEAK